MDLKLKNKKALITGSSSGIGREIAEFLFNEGCHIAVNGRSESKLNEAFGHNQKIKLITGDVTDHVKSKEIVSKTIESLGSLDILICNVGSGKSVNPGEESFPEWEKVFKKNFFSTTNIVEEAKQHLIQSKGVIVCISSICGLETIPGAPITYSVAKSALNTYVKSIARVLGKEGVRINAIAPGNILFKGSVWEKKLFNDEEQVRQYINKNVSLMKFGSTKDISYLTGFLCSPLSEFVTGSVFKIDGGQTRS